MLCVGTHRNKKLFNLTDEVVSFTSIQKHRLDLLLLKKLPSSKGFLQFLVKKRRKTATTVQSDVLAALTDSRKLTTYCLNTLTNIACVSVVNGQGVGISWQKTQGRRGRNSTLSQ